MGENETPSDEAFQNMALVSFGVFGMPRDEYYRFVGYAKKHTGGKFAPCISFLMKSFEKYEMEFLLARIVELEAKVAEHESKLNKPEPESEKKTVKTMGGNAQG